MAAILLAEDDESMRRFLKKALERAGHSVIDAAQGDEALTELQLREFDLLLTDIVMPVMDGIELARRASEIDPEMKIIVKGHADETGSDEFNQFISLERAKTVGGYLTARGVSKDAIVLEALSDTQPIADNTTDEGRQLNRRVELSIQ